MQQSDLMLTTAQIGMALAGFAGLVTLLRHPGARVDARLNEIRFRNMMELGLALTAFSLLPFIPIELDVSEPSAWRLASALYSAAALGFLIRSLRRNRTMMGRVLLAGSVTFALLVVCVALSLGLLLGALGAFPGRESGVYFAALFLHFLAAAFFFIRLLYGAIPREDDQARP